MKTEYSTEDKKIGTYIDSQIKNLSKRGISNAKIEVNLNEEYVDVSVNYKENNQKSELTDITSELCDFIGRDPPKELVDLIKNRINH